MVNIQYIALCFVLVAAVVYAGYRVRETVRRANDRCYGCAGCPLSPSQRKRKNAKAPKNEKPKCYRKK